MSYGSQISEWAEFEGTSVGHLVQLPCSRTITYIWRPRIICRWLLNISKKETPQPLWETCASAQSQNHRMLEIGRDLERSSSPILLPEQEHLNHRIIELKGLSHAHRNAFRRVLKVSREGDSTSPLGSMFQCSVNTFVLSDGQKMASSCCWVSKLIADGNKRQCNSCNGYTYRIMNFCTWSPKQMDET